MPGKRNSPPKEPMTWRGAMPVLIVAGLVDLLRMMAEQLWFFGPALGGIICTAAASQYVGGTIGALACGTVATAAGVAASAALLPVGIVLGEAIGLLGWLGILVYLWRNNNRIFQENALWFAGSLLLSEIPIVGSLPAMTLVLSKMYRTQIRAEAEERKKYEEEQALLRRRQQERERGQMMLAQQFQDEQAAISDAQYEASALEEDAAIPDAQEKAT